MSSKLLAASPQEVVAIAPEVLLVADTYLKCSNLQDTAKALNLPLNVVTQVLNKREVKQYIDTIFLNTGYRNRDNIAAAMDTIIARKLEELEEADISSSKDIADLLALSHKMRMEELAAMTKLVEAQNKQESIKNQTNIQINEGGAMPGNYGSLVEKILKLSK